MLLNASGRVLVGERTRDSMGALQMAQGGLKDGEELEAGALRELREEFGIESAKVEVVARAPAPFAYDQPSTRPSDWSAKFRGQSATYVLARFHGSDDGIQLGPEFKRWEWVEPATLPEITVYYKQALYEQVLLDFSHLLVPWKNT
jgi:putative (di)nucleoside polyphosphate hydrolase